MTTSIARDGPARNWERLDSESLDRQLACLGLCRNRPEPAIICRPCQYALQASGEAVAKHLWEKHQIPPEARKGLTPFVRSLRLPDPNQLPRRPDASPPHPDLAVQRGAACRQCSFRSTSMDRIRRHLSKAHGQKNGRQTWLPDLVHENISLQSWTRNGCREYWIVTDDGERPDFASTAADTTCSPRRRRRVAELHEDQQRRIAADEQSRSTTDLGADDLALTSNWMRRTNWATTFAGADRLLLSLLTDRPAANGLPLSLGRYGTTEMYSRVDDECRLTVIGKAVDHFFNRCEDTARNTDHSVRCWLKSQIPGRPYKAPFEIPGRSRTVVQYRRYWKRLMYFVFRLYRLDHVKARGFLHMQLSRDQRKAVEEVWTAVQLGSDDLQTSMEMQNSSLFTSDNCATALSDNSRGSRSSLRVAVDLRERTLADQDPARSCRGFQSSIQLSDDDNEWRSRSDFSSGSNMPEESDSAYSDEANESDESDQSEESGRAMELTQVVGEGAGGI